MTPPAGFVADLRQYDPDLRVRWAQHMKCWIIEKKMPPRNRQYLGERPTSWRGPRGKDLWDGWKDGYVHVLNVPLDMLDQRVFDVIAESDSWRQGGMDAINRRLDELEEAKEKATDKAIDDWAHAGGLEADERMAWLMHRRVMVDEDLEGGAVDARAESVEHHDGFTVRVKYHPRLAGMTA